MNTASSCRSLSLAISPSQFVEGNGMEEVVGSIPTRFTNSHSQAQLARPGLAGEVILTRHSSFL